MVSWQAFPSLLPRAPLAFLSRLKLPFPKLPLPSLSNACHAGYLSQCHLHCLLSIPLASALVGSQFAYSVLYFVANRKKTIFRWSSANFPA